MTGVTPDQADESAPMSVQWRELVTVALLGTDRRDPPAAGGALGDLVADAARASPSERMLAQVAAATAIRRAAVVPGPPLAVLAPPDEDLRSEIVPAATDRWHHVTTSWPVLEDEWTLTVISSGRRVARETIPHALRRHRTDPVRHARVRVAAGPAAEWTIEQLPELACTRAGRVDPEALAELPVLPIPPDLAELLSAPADEVGQTVWAGLEHGELTHAHRGVLVNLLARVPAGGLERIAADLDRVDRNSSGAALAAVLTDLALTRHRMLDELSGP